MKSIFQHRWLSATAVTFLAALLFLFFGGTIDLMWLMFIFIFATIVFSYPSLRERSWQRRHLPAETIPLPLHKIQKGREFPLLDLFFLPQIYHLIKNRYSWKKGDPGVPGLFLYIYLPPWLYEIRNVGPDTVYQELAKRLKIDLQDPDEEDLIAQRNLPLAFGYRFLPKQGFPYAELSKVISIVKKDYFRENTRICGIIQSRKRIFRLHAPDDDEWRTFFPYLEESQVLHGGNTLSHDFRTSVSQTLPVGEVSSIDAELVKYPEKIVFGSLLTYAKKGEITLSGHPEATDKLYVDRVNVLVNGPENRKTILERLNQLTGKDWTENDLYPLFNYGQKLRGFLESGRTISDSISSHGNFALYYDQDKGWTVLKLEPKLELRLQEAYWNSEPQPILQSASLTTSRAGLITGPRDALLEFQISTGTPTRGQIFSADGMIEQRIKSFARIYKFELIQQIGSGAEGCLYLATRNGSRFYLKSPDGQLANEEIETIENLKKHGLIPQEIKTYPEEGIIVMPEFKPLPPLADGYLKTAFSLTVQYLKQIHEQGYLCLDLTPDHLRLAPHQKKLFLIDFSGYVEHKRFLNHPEEYLSDRKKMEYKTPEETGHYGSSFDIEKLQVYLLGLLFYQLSRTDFGLPQAIRLLDNGSGEYDRRIEQDLQGLSAANIPLRNMLAFDPNQRHDFSLLQNLCRISEEEKEDFWRWVIRE